MMLWKLKVCVIFYIFGVFLEMGVIYEIKGIILNMVYLMDLVWYLKLFMIKIIVVNLGRYLK